MTSTADRCLTEFESATGPNSDIGQSARRPLTELAYIPLLMCRLLAGGMSRDCRKCGVTFLQVVEPWKLRRRDFITFVRDAVDHLATRTPCVPPLYSADSCMR